MCNTILNDCMSVCQEITDNCTQFSIKQITHIFPQGLCSQQRKAKLLWQHRSTHWDAPSTLPDHVTHSGCLLIGRSEAERMKRRGSSGGGGCRGPGWQRAHERKQIPASLPWRWVNSRSGESREGRGLWGTGWPAVVSNSFPYPATKWLGKHGVLWSQKGPKGLREGHHPGVTCWQAHTGW